MATPLGFMVDEKGSVQSAQRPWIEKGSQPVLSPLLSCIFIGWQGLSIK